MGFSSGAAELKLTLNDFSTLPLARCRRPREGRVLNFNVFNPEYQIFGHFSRSRDATLRYAGVSVGFY